MNVGGDLRASQVAEEVDHNRCTVGNQKAILRDKMEDLRGLLHEIKDDNWKYAVKLEPVRTTADKWCSPLD